MKLQDSLGVVVVVVVVVVVAVVVVVELSPRKTLFLLRVFSLGQENHCFCYVCFISGHENNSTHNRQSESKARKRNHSGGCQRETKSDRGLLSFSAKSATM